MSAPKRTVSADNLYSNDRDLLGKDLFFDPRLSQSGSISCASCHNLDSPGATALQKALVPA